MANKGIIYKETYPIKESSIDTKINGEPVNIKYYEIDFNNKKTTIYNRDFELSREGLLSTITSLPTGEVWNKDEAISSPVFKKEYLNHISEEPKINVDVEFDRGNASAFENHFKLMECNTFEDVENYGNNYFNL